MDTMKSRVKGCIKSPKTLLTVLYCLSFGFLGLVLASLGPILHDLAEQTGTDLPTVGLIFPARSMAYLAGSGIGGPLFDRLPGNKIVATSLLLCGLGTIVIPFCGNLWILGACIFVQGLSMGVLDTGGNVMLVWLHGDAVAPFMQLIHFAFGVGAFVSPLILDLSKIHWNSFHYAVWFMGALFFIIGIILCIVKSPKPRNMIDESGKKIKLTKIDYVLVALASCLLFLYVGCEVATGGYLFTYAVEKMEMTEPEGDFLTSVYWGMLALGRFLAIFISFRVSSSKMLFGNFLGCVISTVIVIAFSSSTTALWIGVVGYGFFMSSIFPTVMNLAEEKISLSGKIVSVIVVCGAAGEMALPLTLALLFRNPEMPYDLLFYFNLCWGVLCLVGLGCFLLLVRKKERQEGGALANGGKGEFISLNDIENEDRETETPAGSSANLLKGGAVRLMEEEDEDEEEDEEENEEKLPRVDS